MLFHTLAHTMRQSRLLALLFILTLLPALPAALALYGTINEEAGGSVALQNLLPGLDYTVFADFMHTHGGAIWPLIRVGLWTAVLSLPVGVWAKGGILGTFSHGFSAVTFWQAGTHYFGRNARLLGVTVLFVLLWLATLLVLGTLLGALLAGSFGNAFTERGYLLISTIGVGFLALGLAYILCVSQYASVYMYQTDEAGAFRAFRQGRQFVSQHRRATLGRYLLLLLAGGALLGTYLLLESWFSASNWLLILLLFLLQQTLVFARIGLRVWSLRVAFETSRMLMSH